ncbi:SH3 domain-containing protein [Pseudomonas sp. PS01301]|uniref:SH3 domain-containing protein n=1 Tax=Pseudomonas sp. PS01301 TaxID=2991437 RepID=UPI00249C382B|nr:SH3 domain-containing protein [Pseudomonas sp. PS01301]
MAKGTSPSISYAAELQAQLEALANPSHLAELRKQVLAFTNPLRLPSLRKQLVTLANPTYLAELRKQVGAFANPMQMAEMREQLAALANPPYMAEFSGQVAAFANPPSMARLREQLDELSSPRYIAELRKQVAAFTNPSHMDDLRKQMEALANPSFHKQMREQMALMAKPSYFTAVQEQFSTFGDNARLQENLSAVAASYSELISSSSLARYFASESAASAPADNVIVADISEGLEIRDVAMATDVLDREIVGALETNNIANLSISALQRLQSFYLAFVVVWETLLRIVETYSAYLILTALLSGASTPADVHSQVQQLPNHERDLLADYRVVNREGARLRANPATSAEALLSLPLGTPVEVMEQNNKGWFYVSVDYRGAEIEGWIYVSVTTPVPPPKSSRALAKEPGMK